jgi:DNA-binding MltR family transcriptional regulator
MVWMLRGDEEVAAIKELDTISDRAAAIVGAAILEAKIEAALKVLLFDHARNAQLSIHGEMFRFSGPLGSFSAKINLGFMLGIYTADSWRDMDYIRDIRNSFAHDLSARDFKTQRMRDLSFNLKSFEKYLLPYGTPVPDHSTLGMKIFEKDLPAQLADPRRRYILCIRTFVTALSAAFMFSGSADSKVRLPYGPPQTHRGPLF